MAGQIKGKINILKKQDKIINEINDILSYRKKIKDYLNNPVTELLQILFGGAVSLKASDIHIEPEEDEVKIRIRIDGILQDVISINFKEYKASLPRIKLLAGLKLNITNRPQDGRFSIEYEKEKKSIEVRASTLPAEYGETLVMRILDPVSLRDLEELGLRPDLLQIVEREIKRPNGMIVATGPTGSGKTTTLYAFCKKIKSRTIKIITIEDPIEYHLEGISQTQVDSSKKYDFASGLKSIVRQDPDVILVGEMRDEETVNMALQAALTGHLVLTTLHTNDATGVIVRLISLEGKLANIGPALNMVIGQRLVRKVCKKCQKLERVSLEKLKKIKKEVGSLKSPSIKIPKINRDLELVKATGCKECNFTGYNGRTGIFEVFLINDEMEKFILKEPSIAELKEVAVKKGMVTMKQDGLIKALKKETTIEEIERVMGE